MRVNVKIFGLLKKGLADGTLQATLDADGTVRDLIALYGIPERQIVTVVVNGGKGTADTRLRDGDEVSFFPLVTGG